MCSSSVRIGPSLLLVLGLVGVHSAAAQPVGMFSWQLQPYCNRVTFAVTQNGDVFTVDGVDDQCGVAPPAAASGVASLNPNGTVSIGFSVVTTVSPSWLAIPAALHVDATIDLATLSGTWIDSRPGTGTFAFNASAAGDPRPSPQEGIGSAGAYLGTAPLGGSAFFGRAHRGTSAAPEAVQSGDTLVRFGSGGFTGQAAGFNWPTGLMRMVATEDWSASANGTRIHLSTTANGTTNRLIRVTVDQNGSVGIGTASPADLLDVDGNIRVGTSGTNGCLRNNNGGTIIGTCASDERFKRDVTAYANMLDRVTALQPVQFSWRADAFPDRGFGSDREDRKSVV